LQGSTALVTRSRHAHQRPHRAEAVLRRIALALVSTALSCGVAWWLWSERRLDPSIALVMNNAPRYQSRRGYYTYVPEDRFIHRPWGEEQRQVDVEIDEHGLRNPANTLESADVIVLGDSFASALNTDADKRFTTDLAGITGLRVYDAGVDGFSTFQEGRLLRDLLSAGAHPQTVVLLFYTGNDFRDNFLDNIRISKASFMGSALVAQAMLMHAHPHFAENMAAFRKTGEALEIVKDTSQAKGIRLIVVGIPTNIEVLQTARMYGADDKFWMDKKELEMFQDAINSPDVSFDVADWRLRNILEAGHVEYVSLLAPFREHASERLYGWPDAHWTVRGQALAAEVVAKRFAPQGTSNTKSAPTRSTGS
jgi:hypothetical protein